MAKLKILYGVQGTGNGHISRARMMAKYFAEPHAKKSADVSYLFSGRANKDYFDMDVFGDYLQRRGLTFSTTAGKVKYLQTVGDNNIFQFMRDVRELDVSAFDLVISDFEPVTAWAAKLAGKTSIGIGHQYAFDYAVPMCGQNPVTRLVMRYFAPSQQRIGLHWHHFGFPILPPIIDTQLSPTHLEQRYKLVYLPLENQQQVTALLNQFPEQPFIQYAPTLSDQQQGNTQLRRNCLEGFRNDLRGASGIICNTGFALISECLHMGLPVLTKPLDGQMEQLSNAAALNELKRATVVTELSKPALEGWLQNPLKPPQQTYPDVAQALVEWLLARDWSDASINAMKEKLWR